LRAGSRAVAPVCGHVQTAAEFLAIVTWDNYVFVVDSQETAFSSNEYALCETVCSL
jgi:hypothetical protein